MSSSHTLVRGCLLIGVCLLVGAGGVAVADASEHTTNQTGNLTLHENPEDVAGSGDLASVEDWLGDRMTEIHLNCAENLSLQEEVACDRLDDGYPEYLEQYGSVERDRTGDDNTTQVFEQARENQSELADETREFRESYEEYQESREAGDEERSRRLARDLGESAERIETLGDSLVVQFLLLEEQTGRDFSDASVATDETVDDVSETTAEVQQAEFRPANLTTDIDAETASFRSPATVSGRLTTENGAGLSGREIQFVVDNRTVTTTETDVLGRYDATYQPVTTTTGPTTVRAVYDPTGADEYLGAEATAGVDIEASRPSLFTDVETESAGFGDVISVSGSLTVAAIPAPDVPVAMYLDGERVATGRTDESGDLNLEGQVPGTIPDGERNLGVLAARPGTALEATSENQSITIEETETNLTVVGVLDGDELVIRGELTADGRPVPGQPVAVSVDGETRTQVRTDGSGRYENRVPRDTGTAGVWSVTASYNDTDSNLAPTSTTEQLRATDLEATNGTERNTGGLAGRVRQVSSRFDSLSAIVLGLLVLLPLTAGYYLWRRRDDDLQEETTDVFGDNLTPAIVRVSDDDASDWSTATDADGTGPSVADLTQEDVIDVARARLGSGNPAEAVEIGYGAVRRELGDGAEAADTRTHWEFYRDCEPELPDEQSAALERLTDAYERAAFAPQEPNRGTARAALEAATECLEPTVTPGGGSEEST